MCDCQSVSDTTEELKHTTRGRDGELNGFEAQSQENKRRHSCDIYFFVVVVVMEDPAVLVEFLC